MDYLAVYGAVVGTVSLGTSTVLAVKANRNAQPRLRVTALAAGVLADDHLFVIVSVEVTNSGGGDITIDAVDVDWPHEYPMRMIDHPRDEWVPTNPELAPTLPGYRLSGWSTEVFEFCNWDASRPPSPIGGRTVPVIVKAAGREFRASPRLTLTTPSADRPA
jgi:hypothetical protein